MFLLEIERQSGKGFRKFVKTSSPTLTIGRSEDCQICLKNPYFSGVHATLVSQGNGMWMVTDGGSRKKSNTGLSIEGRKVIGSALLSEGQTLTLIDQFCDVLLPPRPEEEGAGTSFLKPANPIKATLRLLPTEEVIANGDVTLSRGGREVIDAQVNQNLLQLIDRTKDMPNTTAALLDVSDRLLALETSASSANMIDEVMTARMESMKGDYEKLTRVLKRKLDAFEGKYRVAMIILLVMLVLKLGEGYTPTELKSWVELLEKVLPLVALFQEMRSKR